MPWKLREIALQHFIESEKFLNEIYALKKEKDIGKKVEKLLLKNLKILQNYALKNPDAQYIVGSLYASQKNHDSANYWLGKAAENGNIKACYDIGERYNKGLGLSKNKRKALRWYKKASDKGYAPAQYEIADAYFYGYGVKKNFVKSFLFYKKAALQDYAPAQESLGIMHDFGQGVKEDDTKAFYWYKRAAKNNRTVGQYNLGCLYYGGLGTKKVTKKQQSGLKLLPIRITNWHNITLLICIDMEQELIKM